MPRLVPICAVMAAALAGASPALADGPDPRDVSRPGHASAWEHPSRSRHHVWRGGRGARPAGPSAQAIRLAAAEPGAGYGPDVPAATYVELREPYIGRGLAYNVPPEPAYWPSRAVIRARY